MRQRRLRHVHGEQPVAAFGQAARQHANRAANLERRPDPIRAGSAASVAAYFSRSYALVAPWRQTE
jgi:hypothetical protein